MKLIESLKGLSVRSKVLIAVASVLVIAGIITAVIMSRGYYATTMRLLKIEGTVSIEDAEGNSKPVIDNVRFSSGEALSTGYDGLASVGLDDTKIVTLENDSRVEFTKSRNMLELNLTQGGLFFEVTEHLEADETFDIRTATMTVGIRGTSGYVFYDDTGRESLVITDGCVHVVATNPDTHEVIETDVNGGYSVKVYLYDETREDGSIEFFLEELDEDEIPGFPLRMLAENPELLERVCDYTGWNADQILALVDDIESGTYETEETEETEETNETEPTVTPEPEEDPTPVPTDSPTPTDTPTPRPTATGTPSVTGTPVTTGTGTPTPSGSPTPTPSATPTDTPANKPTTAPTAAPTVIPTDTPSTTPTAAPTDTPTVTPTDTPTVVPTDTPSVTPTDTPTATPTDTPTATPTDTPTATPTPTDTSTPTPTDTSTPTPTDTPSPTPSEPTIPEEYSDYPTEVWGRTDDYGHTAYVVGPTEPGGEEYYAYTDDGTWVNVYYDDRYESGTGALMIGYFYNENGDSTRYDAYFIISIETEMYDDYPEG